MEHNQPEEELCVGPIKQLWKEKEGVLEEFIDMRIRVVLATVQNALVGYRSDSDPETELLQRVLPPENPQHCNWFGFTTKNPSFNITSFAPIKYVSSDRIMI